MAERKAEFGLYGAGAGMAVGGGVLARQQYARSRAQRVLAGESRGGQRMRTTGAEMTRRGRKFSSTVRDVEANWVKETGADGQGLAYRSPKGKVYPAANVRATKERAEANAFNGARLQREGVRRGLDSRAAIRGMRRSKALGRVGLGVAGLGAVAGLAGFERGNATAARRKDRWAADSYRDIAAKQEQRDGRSPAEYRAMSSRGGLQRDAAGNMKRADRKANPKQLKHLERGGFARNDGESTVDYHNRARSELSSRGVRNALKGDAAAEWLRQNREEMDKPMPHAYKDDKRYAQPKLYPGSGYVK